MRLPIFGCLVALMLLSACSSPKRGSNWSWDKPSPKATKPKPHFKVGRSYTVKGCRYHPKERYSYRKEGIASWYGPGFHGRLTANGEVFDMNKVSAAHKTLQLPCMVKVTNLHNGRILLIRVNDRGPYHHNRIIDLSKRAAYELGVLRRGTARVQVEIMPEHSRKLTHLARRGKFPDHAPRHYDYNEYAVKLALKPDHIRTVASLREEIFFSLQIKGIASPEKALDYQEKLAKVGCVGIKEYAVNGQRSFALHIGPYQDKMEAVKMARYLKNMGHSVDLVKIK